MPTFGPLDYTAVALYMALMAGIGVFFGKFVHGVGDYLKGGGTIPWVAAGVSNYMGMFSTFVFVAYAGIAYAEGLVALTVLWSAVPASLLAAAFIAERWRRAGIMTPTEYLETRFNASARQVLSWSGLGFRLLDNTVRLYALGVFVAAATPLGLRSSILVSGLVILAYTVAGGLWAVVVTDVVQFVILLFTTLLMVPLSLRAVGGLGALTAAVPDHFSLVNGPKGTFWFLAAYYVMIALKYNGSWAFIQRFYCVRDEQAARKSAYLMAALFLVGPVIFLLPALAARVALPELDNPEMAYVAMSLHVLPSGLIGLMVAAMFAATMSSLSSDYNVMAGVVTRDIYVRLFRADADERRQVWVARLATLVISLLIVVGALRVGGFGGAFEANKLFTGLFAIPMAVPLVLGVLVRGPRPWGALATLVVGIATGLVLNAHPEVPWEIATLVEIAVCVGVLLLSSFVGPATLEYRERVRRFFARLETPVPESEKPVVEAGFHQALARLFTLVFVLVGFLYLAMAIPSIGDLSGRLAVLVGVLCLVCAVPLHRYARRVVAAEDGAAGGGEAAGEPEPIPRAGSAR